MSTPREELADIARAARRYVERERAGGSGELLADGAAQARKTGDEPGLPSAEAPGGPGEPRGESKPAGSHGSAEAGFASARAGRMPAPSGREALPVRPEPVSAQGSVGSDRRLTNLFGEEEPEAPPKATAAPTETATIEVAQGIASVFDDDLNPAGLEPRLALAAASVPVLDEVASLVRACTKCGLCETRTRAVPGVGTARSGIVFVGEAPGADEDRLGEPFVGRAGQLLDKIIKAMDEAQLIPGMPLDRSTVYICNVLKCRPPENRNPLPHEIEACSPYLRRQLDVLMPRIICCLGKFAAELLVGVKGTIGSMRGKVYRYQGAKLIVTYHPAYLLRNPDARRPVWEDMRTLAREYLSD